MRFSAAIACLAVGLALLPAHAAAITLREVIELTRAGVGEEVLLALIEIDQRVFPIDQETIRSLKAAGVSEKVIVAIVKSGRTPAPPLAAMEPYEPAPMSVAPPEPPVVVVERERPVVHEVAVPVPVYVAVPVERHSRSVRDDRDDRDDSRKRAEPVYWGWGGKRRPDAWQPSPSDVRRDQRRDR